MLSFTAPPLLTKGDRVRIVAPASPFERVRFELGVACLRAAGLSPVFNPEIFARHRYLAGTDERRLSELHAALNDPKAAAIWCARGGYGTTRLLPNLDRDLIAAVNKWLIGFSDITALHCQWQRAHLASLHGPVITHIAGWSAEARQSLWAFLFAGEATVLTGKAVAGSEAVTGPVIGGNLATLASMNGTGFLPDTTGAIILLEDIGERPYRLDRALTALFQANAFAGAVGFAIGQLSGCEEPPGRDAGFDALTVVTDTIAAWAPGVPIVANLPVGHDASAFPVPLGWPATLDPRTGQLRCQNRRQGFWGSS